ncbi:MAG: T9SS type A sorting domain-containing protein [Ignavibacteriales bacterium]|nr:T9SS type A sorting domain-containing protein [Ignavibacteriales bacterium]
MSNISGLQQNTPYHNRLIAEMCDGARIYGNDLQFTTLPLSSIELTSPNGGENWQVGSQEDITWSTIGIENVKIEYSIDDGIYWNPVINSTSANSGTYSWMIPNTPSTQCKVRISDVLNSSIADTSSNTFTISEAPIITVTTPSTGTIWEALSQQTVTWTSVNVLGNVNIKLDTDGSLTFPITLKSNTTNDSTELITVPDNPSSTCRIRVESFGNPTNIFGLNNGNFTITPPVDVHDILNNQPTEYSLHQNFPNPFNPVTRIYYAVPTESPVTIRLYDILGKEIKLLVDEIKTTGNYWIDLDASELHSGVYIYQMRSVKFNQSKKLILMK